MRPDTFGIYNNLQPNFILECSESVYIIAIFAWSVSLILAKVKIKDWTYIIQINNQHAV